ncbi:hypothetical protein KCU90_g3804, partial [Aureobasidium melanogenum]
MLAITWFGLIGLMLVFYVVTDGFDLGIGILSLLRKRREDHDVMVQTIGHVWDANETWLVVLGGALFGAFPDAYALLLQDLYLPVMLLIAGLIMRGAAIEFRHSVSHGVLWDKVFGIGSLVAAIAQGVILGKVLTGLAPGELSGVFVAVSAVGVVAGYSLLGSTYLVKRTVDNLVDHRDSFAKHRKSKCPVRHPVTLELLPILLHPIRTALRQPVLIRPFGVGLPQEYFAYSEKRLNLLNDRHSLSPSSNTVSRQQGA